MKLTLMITVLLFQSFVFAKVSVHQTSNIKCKLPREQVLTIGCSYNCGRLNRWAMKWYARKLGYKLKIVNLSSKNQTLDFTQVDGILIPGGVDVDPKWYIPSVTSEFRPHLKKLKHYANYTAIGKKRDQFEFNLLAKYFKDPEQRYQPILGICRGMQVLTASQGIPLYLDLKKELGLQTRFYTIDKVRISNPESLISELVQRETFRAVELHHQGLNVKYYNEHQEKWPHLEVTSYSNRGRVAETLEFYKRPVLGVQFHPELTFGKTRRNIFKWLLKRACFNKVMKENNGV
jgi:gamma-glutamyl-gamma-aminobutyrate hydrolase PuuD